MLQQVLAAGCLRAQGGATGMPSVIGVVLDLGVGVVLGDVIRPFPSARQVASIDPGLIAALLVT